MPGGAGFGRLRDGRPVFADGALPGDRVRALVLVDKKGYVEASRFELVEPSPERVEPVCPIASTCGGCDWMALAPDAQARHKAKMVREALERTGGVVLPVPPVVSAGDPLGYRLRVRLHVDARGRVGFFGRHSRSLVQASECSVVVPALRAPMTALATLEAPLQGTLGRFAAVELRATPDGDHVELELVPRDGPVPDPAELRALLERLSACAAVSVTGVRKSGPRRYPLPDGVSLRVPTGAFAQVNWPVNEALVAAVVAGARRRAVRTFVDLYAGVGNFSLPLARAGLAGVSVERERIAVVALREAAAEQGFSAIEALIGDVPATLSALVRKGRRFELAVLDPPRAGAKTALEPLSRLGVSFIAYVACDPVTLARDVRALGQLGWKIDELICFDMFPQTHHVETLAWLVRAPTP